MMKIALLAIVAISSLFTVSSVYATVVPYTDPYQVIDGAGAGTERLTISAGLVGVGTTTPTHPLTMRHTDDNSPSFAIHSASDANKRLLMQYDGASNIAIIRAIQEGVGSTSLALNPFGGNVGVGTLGPTHPLTMRHTDDNSPAFAIHSASDTNKRLYMQYDGATNVGIIRAIQEGVGSTSLALNPFGGNVGIGTLSPAEALDLNGNMRISGNITSLGPICIGAC